MLGSALVLEPAQEGQSDIKWNKAELDKEVGLSKQELLDSLTRAAPSGAGEVSWTS